MADRLFAPQQLTVPAEGQIFVRDNSPYLRFYGTDGTFLTSLARDTSAKDLGLESEFTVVQEAVGSEVVGEIYARYLIYRKSKDAAAAWEQGIGRFRATEKATRLGPEDIIEPIWTEPYATGTRGGTSTETVNVKAMAWNYAVGELLVLQERIVEAGSVYTMQIIRYSPDGREIDPPMDVPHDGDYNPFSDMSVGPDGRIYLLDDLHDFVLIMAADGTVEREVPVSQDARSVAGGPPSAEGSIFSLREHGAIERIADDGSVTARLDGRAVPFSDPTFITDMVVDGDGKVYVADGQASLISVFEPTYDVNVLPVPNDGECDFLGQKTADPLVIGIGETVKLDLLLSGSCGVSEDPTDIVIVVPYLRGLVRGKDQSRAIIDNMLGLGRRVNFARHRIGIASYLNVSTLELELTDDRDTYIDAVLNITRLDPASGRVAPSLKKGMETGNSIFEPEAGRRQVMVLLSAQYCDVTTSRRAADCSGWDSAEETATEIREAGTQIIVSVGKAAANLASSDEDVVDSFEETHRRMVNYRLPDVTASNIEIVDQLPGNMRVVEPSISAGGVWADPSVTWNMAEMRFDPIALSLEIEPQEAGTWPTNVEAYAELTDGWGVAQRIDFPVPEVEVLTAPPTVSPTPEPTPTREPSVPGTVYMPWLGKNICWPKNAALDLVLVLDTSSSMEGEKLAAATAAIESFLDLARLEPGDDLAALVTFDSEPRTLQGLTSDGAALTTALSGVETGLGTRIDLGLNEAVSVLDAGKRESGALPVIILLSDGRQDAADEDGALARAAGDTARKRGYEVYTIGLREDADAGLLRELATTPDRFVTAPGEAALEAIYAGIADRLVGCP